MWYFVLDTVTDNDHTQGGIFSSGRKSPKDKATKDKVDKKSPAPIKLAELQTSPKPDASDPKKPSSPSHTRPYEYTENDDKTSPTRRTFSPGAFRYDEDPTSKMKRDSDSGQLSPNSQARRATGLAFNYAPGDDDALRQQAEKLKAGELSPRSKDKTPKTLDLSPPIKASAKSYSPSSATRPSEPSGLYKPHDDSAASIDPTAAFLAGERDDSLVPVGAPDARKKRVKILVIVSKYDPKTRRIDTASGAIEHSTGILNTENGRIETKYGVVDPKKGSIDIHNTRTGNTDTHQGSVDAKTGNIHLTSGVTNPQTGNVDDTLGQVICIAPQDKPVIDVTGIVGRLSADGKVDIVNGTIERSRGLLDLGHDIIETKYGNIDLKSGEIRIIDPKTGKITSKQSKYDKNTGLFTIPGAIDPKTGKFDANLGVNVALGTQIDPVVEVTLVTGKLDKKGVLDAKTTSIENSTGQVNSNTGKIDTKYGQIDLIKHTITLTDPKTGKTESKDFKVDPVSGQILITKNVVNPKTGKLDKDYAQFMNLKIVNRRLDSAGQVVSSAEGKDVVVDSKTNKIWVAVRKDPTTDETSYSSSQVDPKTGTITIIYGLFNPKTNEIEKQTKLDPNVCVTNEAGTVFTSTGDVDEATKDPIFATSLIEPETRNIVTKVSKIHPQTGEIVLVRVDYPKASILAKDAAALVAQQPQQKQQRQPTPSKAHAPTQAKQVTPPKVPTEPKPHSPAAAPTTTVATAIVTTPTKPKPAPAAVTPTAQSATKAAPSLSQRLAEPIVASVAAVAAVAESIVPQKASVIEIVTIVGVTDASGKLNLDTAQLERSRGVLNIKSGVIETKYGRINPATREIEVADPKSGKVTTKPITIDSASGQISIAGAVDPKTGKVDSNARQVINLGSEINPIVEVTAISGKYDSKKGIIDPKTAVIDVSAGQFDSDANKITTSYGELDIPSSTITFKHPKTGKLEKKEVKFDATTGQVILRNEINPKTGKLDKDYGRIVSLRIVHRRVDPVTGKVSAPTVTAKDIIVDTHTNQIWVPETKDPITNETVYTSAKVDPVTGYIITLYGYLDPKTNQVKPQTSVQSNITKVDDKSGQLYVATGDTDENTGEPLFVTSQVDEESGEVYTKVAKVDRRTGKLVLVKIVLITKKDERGVAKELDANSVDVDPSTGAVRNVFNKTVYVYNMVDPVTGEIIQVDPNDP